MEFTRLDDQNRASVLDEYKTYLDERWSEGCTNAWKLLEEIVPFDCKGSYQRVRAHLIKRRTAPRLVVARPPSPRAVAEWSFAARKLSETEQLRLKTVGSTAPNWTPSSVVSAPSRLSKIMSTGSRCSTDRCSAAQASNSSASQSCWREWVTRESRPTSR
ncbi:hypothetical protein [Streptomyces sp. NPDC090798]|uniref:hypothetical protein n=1 Tax=Streptomyces sp. NPDC090798 TaxID=3365968 RepID=UPI00380E6344